MVGVGHTPQGWYYDPWGQAPLRWWDGYTWTPHLGPPHLGSTATGPWNQPSAHLDPQIVLAKEQRAARWLFRTGILNAIVVSGQGPILYFVFRSMFRSIGTMSTGASPSTSGFETELVVFQLVFALFGLLSWGYFGVRIWWTHRVCSNGKLIGFRQQYDPVLTAASWILPIVQYWFPYVGIRDSVRPTDRPKLLRWWWASTILVPFVAVLVGAGLTYLLGWWAAVPAALAVGALHVYLERTVSEATLQSHRTDLMGHEI
jgi:Protein of unknown function (DUF2510)